MDLNVAGIIFDKDGTLFDFNKTWGAITKTIIENECAHNPSQTSALADALGFDQDLAVFRPGSIVIASTAETVAEAILPFTLDQDKDALIDRMTRATSDTPQVQVTDLQDLFFDLRRRDLKLGIATNDGEAPARANLAQANVTDFFGFIAGYDSGFGEKPAPGQLLAFCEHENLKPAECVMVGDSLHDLHAGRAAGMRTVGVLTGPALHAELSPFADIVLDSIADLPNWLDQLLNA